MDKYLKNRFKHYNDCSVEELERAKKAVLDDIEYLYSVLEDSNASSEQKSEILNSDLKFDNDELEYLTYLLEEKKGPKTR